MEIAALWEEETQQSIGVFVRSALPWFVRLREIDQSMEFGFQSLEFREFRPIVQTDAFYRDVLEAGRSQLSLAKRPASLTGQHAKIGSYDRPAL